MPEGELKGPINYEEEYKKLSNIIEITKEKGEEWKNKYEKVKEENENYSVKITILEQDNKEYKRANEGLAEESKDRLKTIMTLKRQIEDNTENACLRNKIEEGNQVVEAEYENKLFLVEQKINELKEELELSKQRIDHKQKCISNMREIIKKLSEMI